MKRKLIFYSNTLVNWALKNGFQKEDWDGKRKVLVKKISEPDDLGRCYRIFILPQTFTKNMWRGEIWPPDFPNSTSLGLYSVTEKFLPKAVKFLEEWFKQTKE